MRCARSSMQPRLVPTLFKERQGVRGLAEEESRRLQNGLWLKIAEAGANEPSVSFTPGGGITRSAGAGSTARRRGLDSPALHSSACAAARSVWSGQRRQVAALIGRSRMQAPGCAADRGRQGRQTLSAGLRTNARPRLPEDLWRALEAEPEPGQLLCHDQRGQSLRGTVAPQTAVERQGSTGHIAQLVEMLARDGKPSTSSSPCQGLPGLTTVTIPPPPVSRLHRTDGTVPLGGSAR